MMSITDNVQSILSELPDHVRLVAAVKNRTVEEIREAVEAGVHLIGENYVQEAASAFASLGRSVQYHFIGRLQGNKAKKAVDLFDLIETVDSVKIAREIDRHAGAAGRVMPVLLEINSAKEPQKSGVFFEQAETLLREITEFGHVRVSGLMTMGPFLEDPEGLRPYFRETKACFDRLSSLSVPAAEFSILSMGMSDSYRIAIEEGANQVRIGTALFGERPPR
ncbi:MAG TPA: YggS family pyridoxal phosphate-dependent enzyme [bacterium]